MTPWLMLYVAILNNPIHPLDKPEDICSRWYNGNVLDTTTYEDGELITALWTCTCDQTRCEWILKEIEDD